MICSVAIRAFKFHWGHFMLTLSVILACLSGRTLLPLSSDHHIDQVHNRSITMGYLKFPAELSHCHLTDRDGDTSDVLSKPAPPGRKISLYSTIDSHKWP